MKQNAKKNVPLVKQNVIDKELVRRERRDWGEGEERGLRKGVDKDREKREEFQEKHRHLPLLVVQLPQGTEFPTRFCSKALQQ